MCIPYTTPSDQSRYDLGVEDVESYRIIDGGNLRSTAWNLSLPTGSSAISVSESFLTELKGFSRTKVRDVMEKGANDRDPE